MPERRMIQGSAIGVGGVMSLARSGSAHKQGKKVVVE